MPVTQATGATRERAWTNEFRVGAKLKQTSAFGNPMARVQPGRNSGQEALGARPP